VTKTQQGHEKIAGRPIVRLQKQRGKQEMKKNQQEQTARQTAGQTARKKLLKDKRTENMITQQIQ
jgi:hypothetical protein